MTKVSVLFWLLGHQYLHASAVPVQESDEAVFRTSALFGDHMVLQATETKSATAAALLRGYTSPHEVVTLSIEFQGHVQQTIRVASDDAGEWAIPLNGTMNQGPFVVKLTSMGQTLTASDVWFGTVLLCGGQSNMELSMEPIYNSSALIASANTPEIRLYKVPISTSLTPLPMTAPIDTQWQLASPSTVAGFSAICYLTARELSSRMTCEGGQCHFGLVQSCLGSTDVQSWMSAEAREEARTKCWSLPGQPTPTSLPPSQSHAPRGNTSGHPSTSASLLFNAMISPLRGYPLGGLLWDQGENNAHYCTVHQYNCLFATMLTSWRDLWNQSASSLPVTFVQIGGYDSRITANDSAVLPSGVPGIRMAQSDTLPSEEGFWSNNSDNRVSVENSAVAASYDLCSPQPGRPQHPSDPGYSCWIHARNKSEVARRVALQHLQLRGMTPMTSNGVEYSGPVVKTVQKNPFSHGLSPTVTLIMDHSDALTLSPGQGCVRCCNQTAVGGGRASEAVFELANRKGIWLPALGSIQPDGTVLVEPAGHARTVANDWVSAVRYAVIDEPQCVLYNSASLPALPFQLPVPWKRV